MAGKIDREWLDKLQSMHNIVNVVGRYVPLERKGRNYWARCPFHHEKTASFSVNEDAQFYHCFGCGVSGDVIKFVQQMENIDFMDAVKMLADEVKLDLPSFRSDDEIAKTHQLKQTILNINREAAKFYHSMLMSSSGGRALSYLHKRGINDAAIKKFGLGYCPPNGAINHLLNLGFTQDQLIQAGIAAQNSKGVYDVFYGRVIVPIIDAMGQVIGFGGRTLDPNDNIKYRNTQATAVFDKSSVLFAINELKRAKRNAKIDYVILAEGYMDVIALHIAGFNTAVASMGTSLTQRQAKTISRYAPVVYISYDGDTAGQKATICGLDILEQEGLDVRVIALPEGLDPDEYIGKYGAEQYKKLLESAVPLMRYKLTAMSKEFDLTDIVGKTKFAEAALLEIKKLSSQIKREGALTILQELTGFLKEKLQSQMGAIDSLGEEGGAFLQKSQDNSQQNAIKYILWAIINYNGFLETYRDVFEVLSQNRLSQSQQKFLEYIKSGGTAKGVFLDFEGEEQKEYAEILNFGEQERFRPYTLEDNFEHNYGILKINALSKQLEQLYMVLDNASDKTKADALQKINDIIKQIQTLKQKRSSVTYAGI